LDLKYSGIQDRTFLWRRMLLKLTASIPLLENFNLRNWRHVSGLLPFIWGGLKSLWWATSIIIEFSLYSGVEKSKYGLALANNYLTKQGQDLVMPTFRWAVNSVPEWVAIPEFPLNFKNRASCYFKREVVIFTPQTLILLIILTIITQSFCHREHI
jgi:hypothetical protein